MTERTSERIWRAARAAYESRGQLKVFMPWDDLRQVSCDIEYDAMVAAFGAVQLISKHEMRIAELEAAGNDARACLNMLLLCGEEGGKRQDEKPAAYLRRLIDALIKAEARVRFLEGRIDAAVVELQRVRAERTEKANARIAELEAVRDAVTAELAKSVVDASGWQVRAERAEAALKPFAEYAERVKEHMPGWFHDGFHFFHGGRGLYDVPMAWFIAALKAYRGEPAPPAEDSKP